MVDYLSEYFFCGIATLLVLLILRLVFGKQMSGRARFFLVLYVLYLSAMFNVVGLPGIPYVSWDPTVNLIPFSDYGDTRFFWLSGMNVLMLVPLGFLLPNIWGRFHSFWDVLLTGFLTSASIELLQLFSSRATDVDDLIFNTLGTCVGFLLAKLLTGRYWRITSRGNRKDAHSLLTVNALVLFFQFFLRYPMLSFLYELGK